MQTHPFTHNNEKYEVRIISDGYSVFVRVFKDNRPANGLRYEVTIETIEDASNVVGIDLVRDLISTAQSDVTNN